MFPGQLNNLGMGEKKLRKPKWLAENEKGIFF